MRTRDVERAACTNCGVDHAPALTDGACPVCGTATPGHAVATRLDPDQRLLLVVGTAMVANLLLLGWLAVLYLRA